MRRCGLIVWRDHGDAVIWTGTCGFGRRQSDVMRDLAAVEIQETFYRPIDVARASAWRTKAPPGFRFSVKASQFITHDASSPTYRRSGRIVPPDQASLYGGFQDTHQVREGWAATQAIVDALQAVAVVFQAPATFGPTEEHRTALYRFFESIRTDAIKGLELRGPWASHIVERLCEDLGLVHVVDPFDRESATYGLAYFRLHGSPPGPAIYSYTYTDADLIRLQGICNEYDDAYVLFNNWTARADALRFAALLNATSTEGDG